MFAWLKSSLSFLFCTPIEKIVIYDEVKGPNKSRSRKSKYTTASSEIQTFNTRQSLIKITSLIAICKCKTTIRTVGKPRRQSGTNRHCINWLRRDWLLSRLQKERESSCYWLRNVPFAAFSLWPPLYNRRNAQSLNSTMWKYDGIQKPDSYGFSRVFGRIL